MNLVFGGEVALLGFWEYMFGILLTVQGGGRAMKEKGRDMRDGDEGTGIWETNEEDGLWKKLVRERSNSPHPSHLMLLWIPIYNYLYQKFIYVSCEERM
jgi:hypothetical protein